MIKRWPYHVMATRRHQAKTQTKGLNDKLRSWSGFPEVLVWMYPGDPCAVPKLDTRP